jgi:hypothetical protein
VITRAELTEFSGAEHLTPEAIRATGDERASEVVAKVLGLIRTRASTRCSIRTWPRRRQLGGGMQRGTVSGELARSVMQFKSFPIAMVSRHWRRMLDAPKVSDGSAPVMANRLMYGGALLVTTTALGAIALQAKQIVAGKDPIDMRGDARGEVLAQGGGAGRRPVDRRRHAAERPGQQHADAVRGMMGTCAMGPAISTAAQALAIGIENAGRRQGQETHAAAETLNLVRQNAPFVNLWYARPRSITPACTRCRRTSRPGYLSQDAAARGEGMGAGLLVEAGHRRAGARADLGKAVGQ